MSKDKKQTNAQATGAFGEELALKYLISKGYKQEYKNYHSPFGEIDLIVSNEEYIVFVEVKTRKLTSVARPSQWVDLRKQKKLINTAAIFLSEYGSDLQPRFDVIEVVYDNSRESPYINHLENAFWMEGGYVPF